MNKTFTTLALTIVLLAAAVVLWRFDPSASVWYPPCLTRKATGLLCPGCGTARSIHALLHGEFRRAVALNPLTVAIVPILFGWLAYRWVQVIRPDYARLRPPAWLGWSLLVVIAVFAVVRNIPALGLARAAASP